MKYSFIFTHAGCLRMFDALIKEILDQGDRVSITYTKKPSKVGEGLSERLLAYNENISFKYLSDMKIKTPDRLRLYILLVDWLRYFHKDYKNAVALRERVDKMFEKKSSLRMLQGAIKVIVSVFGNLGVRFLSHYITRKINEWVPQKRLVEYFANDNADIYVVSPLVEVASSQVEPVLALHRLGKKVNFVVHSWDNLTNKGLVRLDLFQHYVWNEFQKNELQKYHNVSTKAIKVYGCSAYDAWFDMKPIRTREEFCALNKLDPSKPFVLFTGSSSFISKSYELEVVDELEKCFGSSNLPSQKDIQILIRPHPQNADIWSDYEESEKTKICGKNGLMPVADDAKQYYFESIHYSAAVIGINTSAMIEASIIGVPVISISTRDFEKTQEGTLHFRYLEHEAKIPVIKNLEELPIKLEYCIDNFDAVREGQVSFISSFIRPLGVNEGVTKVLLRSLKQSTM